jgi:hypothetical protein
MDIISEGHILQLEKRMIATWDSKNPVLSTFKMCDLLNKSSIMSEGTMFPNIRIVHHETDSEEEKKDFIKSIKNYTVLFYTDKLRECARAIVNIEDNSLLSFRTYFDINRTKLNPQSL